MSGLHRAKDETRQQDAFSLLVCGGVERLTYALQRGDAFTDRALRDMQDLQRRLSAFSDALDRRVALQAEVIE